MRPALPCLGLLLLLAPAPAVAKPSCGKGGQVGERTGSHGGGSFRISVPAGYQPNTAIPLLFALHGDEGKPDYIYSIFKGLQSSSGGAFILVAPRAPAGGGSWYQATATHTTFIDQLLSHILSLYNIDQDRTWITGWSGGATFLSGYAIQRQDAFAAVVYHMGASGYAKYSPSAGSCKIPARFVVGSQDFLLGGAQKHHDGLEGKGHEVSWILLPGVGHNFQQSTLQPTWTWLQAKTLCGKTTAGSCNGQPLPPPPPDSGSTPGHGDAGVGPGTGDAGSAPGWDAGTLPGTGGPGTGGPGTGGPQLELDRDDGGALVGSCDIGSGPRGWALLVIVGLGLLLARRRRR